jgi:hypothetical protein
MKTQKVDALDRWSERLRRTIQERDKEVAHAGTLEHYARQARLNADAAWDRIADIEERLHNEAHVAVRYDVAKEDWVAEICPGTVIHLDMPGREDMDIRRAMDKADDILTEIFDGFQEWWLSGEEVSDEDN